MKTFMDSDFLLSTETSKKLYHSYAAKMPIVDYHCHIKAKDIAKDQTFDNISKLWLAGDHYKWRLMRANGIDEKYITGDASDEEKFKKWAQTLGKAIGNPLYHWSHLELQVYFGYDGLLNENTAEKVWNLTNEKLKSPSMSACNIIKNSKVTDICTTDDPIDNLKWHKMIAEDSNIGVNVYPTFRPDKAMDIKGQGFTHYLSQLSLISGILINSFDDLKKAISNRINYFDTFGCRTSDISLDFIMYRPASKVEIEEVFQNRLIGKTLSRDDELKFKTAFMTFLAKSYSKKNWVMQVHYGVQRNNNSKTYKHIGPDSGFDSISDYSSSCEMSMFLDSLDSTNELPKTIIYSLNPMDDATIDTVIACFQDSSVKGKIQHGSAWWFNDHKQGMINHMTSLANNGLLANFVGMLTDSRSFLSYTRHEYFRRILCELIGNWVENGEYPNDIKLLGAVVEDISYNNAKNYFNL